MKKRHFKRVRFIIIVFVVLVLSSHAFGLIGIGTAVDPYLIKSLDDFVEFANPDNSDLYWAASVHTKLMCDLNLSDMTYTMAVIAPDTDNSTWFYKGTPFKGIFNGDGYIISNLSIDDGGAGNNYLGLFGNIGDGGIVINLGLENLTVTGSKYSRYYGGLVGYTFRSIISSCYVEGDIRGINNTLELGGLCGYNSQGTIMYCYSQGNVISGESGGIHGGLVGRMSKGLITGCYSSSFLSGEGSLSGLSGSNSEGRIYKCFWDKDNTNAVEGVSHGRKTGVFGKSTAEMQTASTFISESWDFTGEIENGSAEIWTIPTDGGYPQLTNFVNPRQLEGNGSTEEPYLIFNEYDFGAVSQSIGSSFRLMSDLDFANINWTEPVIAVFGGQFEGNGHKISNFHIGNQGGHVGLFGYLLDGSLVNDLGIEDFMVSCSRFSICMGGLCAKNLGGTISNSYVLNGEIKGDEFVGGLVGHNLGFITNCTSTGDVRGDTSIGSLVGRNDGSILDCSSTGNVLGNRYSDNIGGLCGENKGSISNSYATGEISSKYADNLGGLCGSNSGTISKCYATGSIKDGYYSDAFGGLVGTNSGVILNSYATGDVTCDNMADSIGGLCGENIFGSILSCCSFGNVTGGKECRYLGGLVGRNYSSSISNSYAMGNVASGDDSHSLGGLCGTHAGLLISNCYAVGNVSSGQESPYLGGLLGINYHLNSIFNCIWDIDTSGMINGAGSGSLLGMIGENTRAMQKKSTFVDLEWDFDSPIWIMCNEGEYPKLWWQGCNTAPVADAGDDVEIPADANCVAVVILDGSESSDEDGDELAYYWYYEDEFFAEGVTAEAALGLGAHEFTLIVNDGTEDSGPDEVVITVVDRTGPDFSVIMDPSEIWPPNHNMVQVEPLFTVSDNCSDNITIELVDITSDEGDPNDYLIDEGVYLRAERTGEGDGRVYILTYRALDEAGNESPGRAEVFVPHDQGQHYGGKDGDRNNDLFIDYRDLAALRMQTEAVPLPGSEILEALVLLAENWLE